MLKAACVAALKRYWGLVAAILFITAASDWRHGRPISAPGLLVALLVVLGLLCLVAVPVEFHKLRKSR